MFSGGNPTAPSFSSWAATGSAGSAGEADPLKVGSVEHLVTLEAFSVRNQAENGWSEPNCEVQMQDGRRAARRTFPSSLAFKAPKFSPATESDEDPNPY